MLNRRKKAALLTLLMSLAAAGLMTGCQTLEKDTESRTESGGQPQSQTQAQTAQMQSQPQTAAQTAEQTEAGTETLTLTETGTVTGTGTEKDTEAQTELQTDVIYTSQDGTVRITLPDSSWKATQDTEEMRVFSSADKAMINIVHADTEKEVNALSVIRSEDELKETLLSQYNQETSFDVLSYETGALGDLTSYEYVVQYNDSASMWAYSVTLGIYTAEQDEAYVITGTMTEKDQTLLSRVEASVESFQAPGNSAFAALSGSETEEESESGTESESDQNAELDGLKEYEASVVYYASDNVNIRQYPGTDAEILASLSPGEAVSVTGETSQWYRVDYGGTVGYVSKEYLQSAEEPDTAYQTELTESMGTAEELANEVAYDSPRTLYATSAVYLREQPGTDSTALGSIESGTALTVTGETANWYVVTSAEGVTGYVTKAYVSSKAGAQSESETEPPASQNTGETAGTSSAVSSVEGTITEVTADILKIQGDDGTVYSVNYLNAAVNAPGGLSVGLRVTAELGGETAVSPDEVVYAATVTEDQTTAN